jgi:16S rRNA (guanine1516-N2)-methyltransferase
MRGIPLNSEPRIDPANVSLDPTLRADARWGSLLAELFGLDGSAEGVAVVSDRRQEDRTLAGDDYFQLSASGGALDLRPPGQHSRPGIRATFPPDRGGAGRNPLVRAFGKRTLRIFDLTAGLGGDAYRLARAGHAVRAAERDSAVFALLASGWRAACEAGSVPETIANRLEFTHQDGDALLSSIEGLDQGVYIDPMYPPPKRSSAKPRRELQVLRALLGGQTDAAALVERARPCAARVVVKRPHHAEALVPGASFEVETKLVRFDVYVNPEKMSPATTLASSSTEAETE